MAVDIAIEVNRSTYDTASKIRSGISRLVKVNGGTVHKLTKKYVIEYKQ
jgi:hypothetical protein